jgi:hypothetical protein
VFAIVICNWMALTAGFFLLIHYAVSN